MDRSVPPPPASIVQTRASWHLIAAHVLAEERWRRLGRIGLEPRPAGIATPRGEAAGVALEGDQLVVRRAGEVERETVTTLDAARRFVLGEAAGPTWAAALEVRDPPPEVSPSTPLSIDPDAARWLGAWFQLGWWVLEELGAEPTSIEASTPTLWPEHLDVAIEVLPDDRRGSYGVSPGDDAVPEPYAYVSVWYPDRVGGLDDPRWNATAFPGAIALASGFGATGADTGSLLAWFRERRDLLAVP
jgi:hypothetical protein